MLYLIRINLNIRHGKKTIPPSLVIPYKSAYSNAGFNVANTNRMMKIHVAKQLKYVKVIL